MARDPNGWADLKVEQLDRLEQEDFEEFCLDLVRCEAYDRHDSPKLDGPAGSSVPDGGRDILLEIVKPPLTRKTDYQRAHRLGPLTEDEKVRTAYSCKSGDNWIDLTLRDIRGRKNPGRAVEVLLGGGYFKLFINVVGKRDAEVSRDDVQRKPHAHIAAAFWERLKKLDPAAVDPTDRIEILDAHAITGFLRARRPEDGGMARWADKFSLVPLLHGLDEWRALHREDRNEPIFVDDAKRTELRAHLLAFMQSSAPDSNERAAWLVGPPGVGKTRLLIQMLIGDPVIAQRVRIAWSSEEAREALNAGRLLARHPSVLLIVDDCPGVLVDSLAAEFRAATSSQSQVRLLVMTPAAKHVLGDARIPLRWFLDPLDTTAAQALAAGVLGNPDQGAEEIQGIVRLSERYPWFITLLAREAIAEQRSPRDVREAAKWAIASFREASRGPHLEALRLRRARGLLAASLTRRIDWDRLSDSQREDVARAVGLPRWQDVIDTALECVKRGILRRNEGWHFKYVTPLVLEREVIAWLFDPDDGPDPGGRTLARHGQAYLSDFFETLAQLDLPSTTVKAIARAGLDDLRRVPEGRGALRAADMLGARLMFVVRHEPGAAARELRRRIEPLDINELRARTDERRGLMFALEELAARDGAFEDAEEALFRLAQAENESYGNNATATWSGLFFPELNATYRSLNERMGLLARRLSEPAPSARGVAILGAQAVLTTQAFRRTMTPLDGERPVPTHSEALLARCQVWEMLAERFADPSPDVAARAKRVATEELRGAVRWGIGSEAIGILAAHAKSFNDAERIKLREALAALRTYDAAWIAAADDALEHLEKRLAPGSFRERLHQHVGTWDPARLRAEAEIIDDALAREGLAGDVPVAGELDWLLSDAAVRAHVFAFALGRCDERALLLPALRERAREPGTTWTARIVFARYLGGWKEAGRGAAADVVVRQLQTVPDDAGSLALAIIELGATEEQLGWIEAALRADLLDAACVAELGRRRHWLEGVSDAAFASFAGVLLEGSAACRAAAALELLVDHAKKHSGSADALRPLLLRALDRLAAEQVGGMTDYYWELGAELLIHQGDVARVAALSVIALSRSSGSNDHAWNALHRAAEREPTAAWRAVAAALEQQGHDTGRLLLAFMFHRSSFAWPPEEVLSWVGRDERRGRTVVLLVPRGGHEFDPILRALVQRFGPHGSVANEILSRMHSTNGLVSSLAEHDAKQLERARQWLSDPDPKVRKFVQRLIESLEQSYAHHAAEEEDEHRRWGT